LSTSLEYRVLGPFEVLDRGTPLALRGARLQTLLAVLLIHRREAVSVDRLVDALWGEHAPATATKAVQVYVSRLRKALGDGAVQTRGHAYRLAVTTGQVDADRFAALVTDGRAAAGTGDHAAAAALLRAALALWRGPPFSEFTYQRFAEGDIAALEEARMQALEDRIAADLACGRHAMVVGEIETLVHEQPLRERPVALQMLALYRTERQAEALDAYRRARRRLDAEVGLAPGPVLQELEAQILRHDPGLAAPASSAAAATAGASVASRPAARRRWLAVSLALAASLAAVAVAVAAVLAGGGAGAASVARRLRAPAIATFADGSGQPRAAVSLASVPTRIVAGLGQEWVTSYDDGTLLRVDPRVSAVVETIRVGIGATGVALAGGDVWVADTLDDRLTRVDSATDQIVQRIAVGASPGDIAGGGGAVWVANTGDGTVSRVDAATGKVLGVTRVGPSPDGIAVGDGSVWVALGGAGAVARLALRTGRLLGTIHVGSEPSAVVVGPAGVWVADELDGTVSLISPKAGRVVLTRPVVRTPTFLTPAGEGVWVAGDGPELTKVTASGRTATRVVPSPVTALGHDPRGVLVGVSGVDAGHRGGTLIVRVSYALPQIDPGACCGESWNMRMLAYDGLLGYSKSAANPGTLVPDLAWAIPHPQDGGLGYTFHLRPGLRYWTGAPVRASDFRRGIERAAHSSDIFASYVGALPGALACPRTPRCDLRAAVITDDRAGTVTLRLTHPDPDLLFALGLSAFAPDPGGGPIRPGTGPYRIARFVPDALIDYERNPYFTEWSADAQPAGYPDRILVDLDGSPRADVADVLAGRADYTFDYPTPSQLRGIDLRAPGLLHTEPLPEVDFLPLDTRSTPFDDARVRRALNLAIDRNAIAYLYGGPRDATPTCQIIPADIAGHVGYCPYTRRPSASGRWSAPDLPLARRLVTASGTRGEMVTIDTQPQSGPWNEPTARYVARVLRKLGYRARVRVVSPDQWSAVVNDYRHPPQIMTDGWLADYPSASQFIALQLACAEWRPPSALNNHAQFCDPAVDRLATKAEALAPTDPAAADRLWARADRLVTDRAPWLSTVTETGTDLVSAHVGDYQYVPTFGPLLDQLWVR
jgi:ABC-type transport system substrate-binding protein/DNA-binding SARP family transcriptional activator